MVIDDVNCSARPPKQIGMEDRIPNLRAAMWQLFGKSFRMAMVFGLILGACIAAILACIEFGLLPYFLLYGAVISVAGGVMSGLFHGCLIVLLTHELVKRGVTFRRYVDLICLHSIPAGILVFGLTMGLGWGVIGACIAGIVYGITVMLASHHVSQWFTLSYPEYFKEPDIR